MLRIILTLMMTGTALGAAFAGGPDPTLPSEDTHGGATRSQAVTAYIKDCHAPLLATASSDGEESQVAECLALDIYQNCSPDIFGCDARIVDCQVACQPACSGCQNSCGSSCDGCKSACQPGDKACIRKCAEARADCRGGCMDGLRQCQETKCVAASNMCVEKELAVLKKGCTLAQCESFGSCVDSQSDYENAEAICAKEVTGLDARCRAVCGHYAFLVLEAARGDNAAPTPRNPQPGLAARCTKAAECPADYANVAPYLGAFCDGSMNNGVVAALREAVEQHQISKRTLSLVFNVYGAMYGYEFKKEKWMNSFFYGGGAWLPPACSNKIKTVVSAKKMPFKMTQQRDRVKGLWNELR